MRHATRAARLAWVLFGALALGGCAVADFGQALIERQDPLANTDFSFPEEPPEHAVEPAVVASPLYRELDRLHAVGGPRLVLPRIAEAHSNPDATQVTAFWLRDHFMHGSAPVALYGLFYFDALARQVDPDDLAPSQPAMFDTAALATFLSSELLALENVARCAAQPNGTNYRLQWRRQRGRGPFVKRLWEAMSPRRRRYAVLYAKARVESAASRPPSTAACGSNALELQAAADAGLCRDVAPSPEQRSDYVGGTTATFQRCDTARFVSYVDEPTWKERRERLRAQYWDGLSADRARNRSMP